MYASYLSEQDRTIKQSAGYIFARLLVFRIFILFFSAFVILTGPTRRGERLQLGLHIGTYVIDIILLGVILNFIVSFIVFFAWRSLEYKLSSHKISIKCLMKRSNKQIDLRDIKTTEVRQTFAGHLFEYGTVTLRLQSTTKPVKLRGVPFPEQFETHLKTQLLVNRNLRNMQTTEKK
ncbi:MAG: PH domain-containing protein [Candidatus Nomurabacteria bacterium]|nr:MAG: PH domain-containing protein [Candidatus Nomurabacteria bacterium]